MEAVAKDSKIRVNRFTQIRRCSSDPGACVASRTRRPDKTCSKMKPSVTDVTSIHDPSVHSYNLYRFMPTNYYYVLFVSNVSKISDRHVTNFTSCKCDEIIILSYLYLLFEFCRTRQRIYYDIPNIIMNIIILCCIGLPRLSNCNRM